MTRKTTGVLAAGLVAVLLSTLGCCDPEKKQIAQLEGLNRDLTVQNQEMRDQLAQSRSRQADLVAALDAANARITGMQRPPAETRPAEPTTAGGWEVGLVGDRLTIESDILFPSGQATLTKQGLAELDKAAATIKARYAGMPVRVYGYTDTDPILKTKKLWQDNLDLSANRAMNVTRHLRSKGIAASMIETVAMGETRPVAPNTNSATKARNRRVEIIVIKSGGR